jgi:hypothetical protein
MNVIRTIVNKFFELRKNKDEISLRDFYSIYMTALLELEVTECKVSVANNS